MTSQKDIVLYTQTRSIRERNIQLRHVPVFGVVCEDTSCACTRRKVMVTRIEYLRTFHANRVVSPCPPYRPSASSSSYYYLSSASSSSCSSYVSRSPFFFFFFFLFLFVFLLLLLILLVLPLLLLILLILHIIPALIPLLLLIHIIIVALLLFYSSSS